MSQSAEAEKPSVQEQALQTAVRFQEGDIARLVDENERLQREVQALTTAAATRSAAETAKLKEELETLKFECGTRVAQLTSDYNAERNRMAFAADNATSENDELKTQLAQSANRCAKLEQDVEDIRAKMIEERMELEDELENSRISREAEIEAMTSSIQHTAPANHEQVREQAGEESEHVSEEWRVEFQKLKDEAQVEINARQQELVTLQEDATQRIQQLQTENGTAIAAVTALQQEVAQRDSQLSEATSRIQTLEHTTQNATAAVTAMREEMHQRDSQLSAATAEVDERKRDLVALREEATSRIQVLEHTNQNAATAITTLQQEVHQTQSQLSAAKQTIDSSNMQWAMEQHTKQNEVDALRAAGRAQMDELSRRNALVADAKAVYDQQNARIAELSAATQQYQGRNEHLEREVARLSSHVEATRIAPDVVREECVRTDAVVQAEGSTQTEAESQAEASTQIQASSETEANTHTEPVTEDEVTAATSEATADADHRDEELRRCQESGEALQTRINQLQASIQESAGTRERELRNSRADSQALRDQISQLQGTLRESTEAREAELRECRAHSQGLRDQIVEMDRSIKESKEIIDKLGWEVDTSQAHIDRLRARSPSPEPGARPEDHADIVSALTRRIEELDAQVESSGRAATALDTARNEIAHLTQMQEQSREVQGELGDLRTENARLAAEMAEMRAREEAEVEQPAAEETAREEAEAEQATAEISEDPDSLSINPSTESQLRARNAEYQATITNLETLLSSSQTMTLDLTSQVAQVRIDNESLKHEGKTRAQQYTDIRSRFVTALQDHDAQTNNFREVIAALEKQLAGLMDENKLLRSQERSTDLSRCHRDRKQLQLHNARLIQRLQTTQAESTQLKNQMAERDIQIAELQRQLEDRDRQLEEARRAIADFLERMGRSSTHPALGSGSSTSPRGGLRGMPSGNPPDDPDDDDPSSSPSSNPPTDPPRNSGWFSRFQSGLGLDALFGETCPNCRILVEKLGCPLDKAALMKRTDYRVLRGEMDRLRRENARLCGGAGAGTAGRERSKESVNQLRLCVVD